VCSQFLDGNLLAGADVEEMDFARLLYRIGSEAVNLIYIHILHQVDASSCHVLGIHEFAHGFTGTPDFHLCIFRIQGNPVFGQLFFQLLILFTKTFNLTGKLFITAYF